MSRTTRRPPTSGTKTRQPAGAWVRHALATLALALPFILPPSEARAGIAFVKNVGTATNQASGTTITVTVPAAGVAAGNTIIVTFAMDSGPTPVTNDVTCTDNGSPANVYTKDADMRNGSGTSGVRTVVFRPTVFLDAAEFFADAVHPLGNLLQLLHHRLNALRADR